MEIIQLPSLKGLAQGKRRRRSSDQAQNDKPATSLLEDALPRISESVFLKSYLKPAARQLVKNGNLFCGASGPVASR